MSAMKKGLPLYVVDCLLHQMPNIDDPEKKLIPLITKDLAGVCPIFYDINAARLFSQGIYSIRMIELDVEFSEINEIL